MGHAERADLAVGFSMAVQEQEMRNAVVAAGNLNARRTHHRDASHQVHAGQLAFEGCGILGAEQFGRSAQVDDRRLKFTRPLLDEGKVGSQEQRRQLRWRENSGSHHRGRAQGYLSGKLAIPDEDADMIDTDLGDRPGFFRS
jgi:hypothetical protein